MDYERNKALLLELQRAAGTGNDRCADCGDPGKAGSAARSRSRADSGRDPSGSASSRSAAVSVRGTAAPLAPCPAERLRDGPAALPAPGHGSAGAPRGQGTAAGSRKRPSTRPSPGLFVDRA